MIYDAQGKQIGEVRGVDSFLSDLGGTQSFAVNGFGRCAGVGGDVVVDDKIAGFYDGGHLGDMVLPNGSCSNSDGYTSGRDVYNNSGEYVGHGENEIEAAALLYIFLPELLKQQENEQERFSNQSAFDTAAKVAATGALIGSAVNSRSSNSYSQSYGHTSSSVPTNYGTKSKTVAGLLGVFLGSLGVHKFYLGYTKEGLIMLGATILSVVLISTAPLLAAIPELVGLVGLIEGIKYLTRDKLEFYATYEAGNKPWF